MRYLIGIIFAFALLVLANASSLTDVRVGPTATISIATSADGKIVYVAHGNGVFKSEDGGANWAQIYRP